MTSGTQKLVKDTYPQIIHTLIHTITVLALYKLYKMLLRVKGETFWQAQLNGESNTLPRPQKKTSIVNDRDNDSSENDRKVWKTKHYTNSK